MNYNFKENWNDVILPLLSMQKVKYSIKKGINAYIKDGNCSEGTIYDPNKCPAFYQRGDGWDTYISEYEEKLCEKFLQTGYLKKDENEPDEDCCDEYFYSDEFNEYENYKKSVIEPFIKHHEKTSLRAYQMFGACHWWNPTFCLTLAKIIYPNEKWIVKEGKYHTTIVNANESLVFDILYFDEDNETKGGQSAIVDSLKI